MYGFLVIFSDIVPSDVRDFPIFFEEWKSKDFDKTVEMVKKDLKTKKLQFGLSLAHGWIMF